MNTRIQTSIGRPFVRSVFILAVFALGSFALSPGAQAVSPAPDGGYPGGNTAEGQSALLSLTTGTYNTAVGIYSLLSLIDGKFCTGVGAGALLANTADQNTATGAGALLSNTAGFANTANGTFALFNNTTGEGNTAIGDGALFNNTTGIENTAIGQAALADTTGGFNTALGQGAGGHLTTGDNNIDIDNPGVDGDSGTIRIGSEFQGQTFIAGIALVPVTGTAVVVDDNGQLGTVASSERFKKDIATMDKASEAVLSLRPVTFHYKSDAKDMPQFGLIAEEVAKVNPDLVVRDKGGKPYTVRYDQVNAMLLNEFLKEHRKVEEDEATIAGLKSIAAKQEAINAELKATVAQQQKGMEVLTAQIKEQAAQVEKVSAQIEMNKPTRRVVLNNP